MLSLSPAAPRSATQTSGQPIQAFCESLLAASKTFSEQDSTNAGGSKSGRRQRSAAGDAKTPSAVFAGAARPSGAVLSPIRSQQTQGFHANVAPLESSLGGLTPTDARSVSAASLFAQSLAAAGLAGTGSSIAQIGIGSTSTVLPTAVESSFTPAPVSLSKMAATPNASRGLAITTTRNLRSAGLTKFKSSVPQASIAQASIPQPVGVQSKVIAVQMPLAGPATTRNTSNAVAIQPTLSVAAAEIPETKANVAQASISQVSNSQPAIVPSKFIAVQMPLDGSAMTQKTSNAVVSQPKRSATAAEIPEIQTSFAQISNVPANISQPAVVQSKFIAVQMPLAGPATTRNTSNAVAIQPTLSVAAAEIPEIQTSFTQISNVPANISQPAVVQSKFIAVQMPLAGSSTTQGITAGLTAQVTQNTPAPELAGSRSIVGEPINVPANAVLPARVQSNVAPAQTPLATPATTQNFWTFAASQPAHGSKASGWNEIQSIAAEPIVVPANTVLPARVQSNVDPAQTPLATPATTQNFWTFAASQPAHGSKASGWNETGPNMVAAKIVLPTDSESKVLSVQTPLAGAATNQVSSIVTAGQPAHNDSDVTMVGTESRVAQYGSVPAKTSRPADTQPNVIPAQAPLAQPGPTQNAVTGAASQPSQNLTAAEFPQSESSVATANIPQSAFVQPSVVPAQAPLTQPGPTQNAVTAAASEPTRSLIAAELPETQASVAQANIVPASIPQPAQVSSQFISAQMPLAGPATTQKTSIAVASEPTRSLIAAELPETQASVAQANIVPASIPQPAQVSSQFIPVHMPLAGPATTQKTSNAVASEPTRSLIAAELPETQASVAQASFVPASIPQPAVVSSQFISAQMPLAGQATTQKASSAVASEPTRSLIAAELPETQASVARANVVPASIPQLAQLPSQPIAAQMPLVGPATSQDISTAVVSQPTRNVTATEGNEAEQDTAPASVLQRTIIEPARVQSSATPLSNDSPRSSSKLPSTRIQDIEAPIAASLKSGNADPIAAATVVPAAAPAAGQDSLSEVASRALSDSVQNAVANGPAEQNPVPVLHAALIASVKDVFAPALGDVSAVQVNPQPAVSDQSPATLAESVSGAIAEQLAALPLSAGPLAANQIAVSNVKPVSAAKLQTTDSTNTKDSSADETGTKKSAEPATEGVAKTGSHDATTAGNQSQGSNTAQAQGTAPSPVNFAVHPAAVIAAAQNAAHIATNHTLSTPADAAGFAAKTADNAAHASTALPQALPVINTAKLIQSMGRSVMRVGMRSNEFGNISISTSASKDLLSAQISLEHGELAKTLAAHLPEMQARLGVNQPMDVRIDMNGAATGQGTGSFGSTQNGSADSSRNSRQQTGNTARSHSGNSVAEQQFSPVATVMPTGYARLDIRV